MSLINDALKKAQRVQPRAHAMDPRPSEASGPPALPATEPGTGTPAAHLAVSPAAAGRSPKPGIILAAAGLVFAGAFALVVVAGFLIWRHAAPDGTEVAAATPSPPAPLERVAQDAADVTNREAPPTGQAGPSATTPAAPVSGPATTAEPTSPRPSPVQPVGTAQDLELKPSDPADTPAEAAVPPPVPPDPRIQTFLLGLKVTGVRTGDRPKVLMNDRVYAIGESVSNDFDLQLTQIAMRRLELTDKGGNVYEVRF